jgi:hypothetical protein
VYPRGTLRQEAQERTIATTMYREMAMHFWREQAETGMQGNR